MDDYITKPVTPERVDAALARWVAEAPPEPDHGAPGATAEPREEVLDQRRLEVLRRMGSPPGSLLAKVVEAFTLDAPAQLAALRHALESRDAAAVRQGGHRLKGSAANLGAVTVASLCAELESAGASGRLDGGVDLVEELERQLGRAVSALRAGVAGVLP